MIYRKTTPRRYHAKILLSFSSVLSIKGREVIKQK